MQIGDDVRQSIIPNFVHAEEVLSVYEALCVPGSSSIRVFSRQLLLSIKDAYIWVTEKTFLMEDDLFKCQ